MSETSSQPARGGTAALKQRREAYLLAGRISEDISDARSMLEVGLAKRVSGEMQSLVAQVERNPVAREMVEKWNPGSLKEARDLAKEAGQLASNEVMVVKWGEWLTYDGRTETKLLVGQSDSGFHYAVIGSRDHREFPGDWSRAFKTLETAEQVGGSRMDYLHDMHPERHPSRSQPAPRAEHATALQRVADKRRSTVDSGSRATKAEVIASAKNALGAARQARTQGLSFTQRHNRSMER